MLEKKIFDLATELVQFCAKENIRIATAESCTGGLVAASITDVPGASKVFDRGFVTYSNDAKIEMLGVTPLTLRETGAVSHDTVLEMAHGALARSESSIVVAITGIAGPDGGTDEKPVGLVHLAAKHYSGKVIHRDIRLGSVSREEIRLQATLNGLELLKKIALPGGEEHT